MRNLIVLILVCWQVMLFAAWPKTINGQRIIDDSISAIALQDPIYVTHEVKIDSLEVTSIIIGSSEITSFSLSAMEDVDIPSPASGEVLMYNATALKWEAHLPSANSYLQTIEVWVSDGSAFFNLAHTPDGAVAVIFENAIWQRPYTDYNVSTDIINFVGGTVAGQNYMFSYIYH